MNLHKAAQTHLAKHDPIMAELIVRYGDCTLKPHTNYYRELVDAIISQQLSVKAGQTIFNRFLALYNESMPTPAQILQTDSETLRSIGCSYAKVSYIKDLSAHIEDGRLDLGHIAILPDDDVVERLVAVKGIGLWSAHMFMIFSVGRTNILPVTDLGIRNACASLYRLKTTLPVDLLQLSQRKHWEPFQSVASWYLWKSLGNSDT